MKYNRTHNINNHNLNKYQQSQNFLQNKNIIQKMIHAANMLKHDLVLDIGAGHGEITKQVIKYAREVVAIEGDKLLFSSLINLARTSKNLKLELQDFQITTLPKTSYKVVSNIPFNQTAEIVEILTGYTSNMTLGILILQKEAADMYLAKDKSCLKSVLLQSLYEIKDLGIVSKTNFKPVPKTDAKLIKLEKRSINKFKDQKDFYKFHEFVRYIFNNSQPNIYRGLGKYFSKEEIGKLGIGKKVKPSDLKIVDYEILFRKL